MSDLKNLIAERKKIVEQITLTRQDRLKTLDELREILYDAISFMPSPHKWNEDGYYYTIDLKTVDDAMVKRINVQKKWVNLDLLTIPDAEFIKIRQMVENEIRKKYLEEIKKQQDVANGMK